MKFAELGLSEPILRAVGAAGYTEPTPIQAHAIPHVLAGNDVLGLAQTGTGKTAAFALPILHRLTQSTQPRQDRGRRIRVLVLSPTRELALQIAENFEQYGAETGLRQAVVLGGVDQNRQTPALRRGVDILVATPGRLLDLIEQGYIDLAWLEVLVLDEADRMLDMGFLPSVRRIVAQLPNERQTLLFSATMPAEVRQLAEQILHKPVRIRVAPVRATTELIGQSVYLVERAQKVQLLVHVLKTQSVTRALVFTRTKRGADRVARQLGKAGVRAEAIHGDKTQSSRQRALASFKSPRPPVLVATDLAARGIDVDAISHVFNYDLPEQPETYVHRIGRTGRAGATGRAIAFCDAETRDLLPGIERLIGQRLTVETDHPEYQAVSTSQLAGRRPPAAHRRTTSPPAAGHNGRPSAGARKKRRPAAAPKKPTHHKSARAAKPVAQGGRSSRDAQGGSRPGSKEGSATARPTKKRRARRGKRRAGELAYASLGR
ncbi:MAG: DEAD/DEAH box helicase [Pirellulales bacterium]|nr:DEAD/DEAH box helicase [Pirellulales bacterium]